MWMSFFRAKKIEWRCLEEICEVHIWSTHLKVWRSDPGRSLTDFYINWLVLLGKITGKSHLSWENRWFPVDFPLNQPIDWTHCEHVLKPGVEICWNVWPLVHCYEIYLCWTVFKLCYQYDFSTLRNSPRGDSRIQPGSPPQVLWPTPWNWLR